MNIKNRKLIFFTTLLFSISILGILPTLAHAYPPDEWIAASDYDITYGSYRSGTLADTYTDNSAYLGGYCYHIWFMAFNGYEITFDFDNCHYKRVVIDATTDPLGHDGTFKLVAYYTTGSPVQLGCFDPGEKQYYTLDYTRSLNKIGLEYWQNGVWGQRSVYVDQINALWTYY